MSDLLERLRSRIRLLHYGQQISKLEEEVLAALEAKDAKLRDIKRELVALKRSIDPHSSDPARYEIWRSDLDPIWAQLYELLKDVP